MPPMQPPVALATTVNVRRSIPVDVSGLPPEEQEEAQTLDVRVFETQPAIVSAQMGQTINLGNYESLKVSVAVSLPCYAEEAQIGLQAASQMVSDFISDEVDKAKQVIKAAKASGRKP